MPFQELHETLASERPRRSRNWRDDAKPAQESEVGDEDRRLFQGLGNARCDRRVRGGKIVPARTEERRHRRGARRSRRERRRYARTSINELSEGSLSPSAKSSLLGRAVGKWSRVDPVAAAKFLDSSDERGMNFSMAWNEVASNWAAIDPVAALDWARQAQRTAGASRCRVRSRAGGKTTRPQPKPMSLLISRPWRIGSSPALAANMFSEDPERAKKWVSQLPNEEARKQAASMLAIQWGFSDPAAATKWSATLPAEERAAALAESVGTWAHEDPAAAGHRSAPTMAPAVIRRSKTSLSMWRPKIR